MIFPPLEWNYNKIIPGSPQSKYDFKYISEFNYELWKAKINEKDFISINIEPYLEQLCQKHIEYSNHGTIDPDDLSSLRDLIQSHLSDLHHDVFMRLSYRSAKDVPEGRLPISSSNQIIIALIKSERCFDDMIAHQYHKLKGIQLPSLCLNLTPWRDCSQERELRCFIHCKTLVAITNQFPTLNSWPFKGKELEVILSIKKFIDELFHKYDPYDSTVMDIELDSNLTPHLIEFNPYGKKGSTGAILFDWEKDKDILFSTANQIVLRYDTDKLKEITINLSNLSN